MNERHRPQTWFAPDFSSFLVAHWEEEYFLFNPRTAHTHVFNQLGMELLQGLAEGPQDIEGIQRRLFGGDTPIDSELERSLREQLSQLVVIGLAEHAP